MSMPFPIPGLDDIDAPQEPRTTRRGPTRDELLEGLNEPQRDAVLHGDGPAPVRARPGC